jgi:hypothetical protein
MTAGIDLVLAMIDRDLGPEVAKVVAKQNEALRLDVLAAFCTKAIKFALDGPFRTR